MQQDSLNTRPFAGIFSLHNLMPKKQINKQITVDKTLNKLKLQVKQFVPKVNNYSIIIHVCTANDNKKR